MRSVRLALIIAAHAAMLPLLRAQAWLPPKDTTTLGFSYQYIFIKQHVLAHGETVDRVTFGRMTCCCRSGT